MDLSVAGTSQSVMREYLKTATTGGSYNTTTTSADGPANAPSGAVAKPLSGITRAVSDKDLEEIGFNSEQFRANAALMLEMQAYDTVVSDALERNQAIFERLNDGIHGLLTGASIPNDLFGSQPVTTTSGNVHPQSDRIKEYLRNHIDEWNRMGSVPTFEEWRQSRA